MKSGEMTSKSGSGRRTGIPQCFLSARWSRKMPSTLLKSRCDGIERMTAETVSIR